MKATTLFKAIAVTLVVGASVFMGTASAQGNARKDKHNNSQRVAPPSNNHRNDRVAPPSRVPRGAKALRHNNRDYYWDNGHCYYNNAIITPPYGLVVPMLPPNCAVVKANGKSYYYYQGDYYVKYRNDYKVVEPVWGMIIDMLPRGAVMVNHRGAKYYKANGIYYKIKNNRRNHTTYQVVGRRLP